MQRPRKAASGLTLIELLVALMVAAALVGVVSVSGSGGSERALRLEAERLALLLALAREEAQVRGRPIRWVTDPQGYRFEIFKDQAWRVIDDDADMRARPFAAETLVRVERADGQPGVEFGRDWVDPPFTVRLQRAQASVLISANGLGDFAVRD